VVRQRLDVQRGAGDGLATVSRDAAGIHDAIGRPHNIPSCLLQSVTLLAIGAGQNNVILLKEFGKERLDAWRRQRLGGC